MIGKWHVGDVPQFGPTKYGYDHFWGFAPGALDYFTHRVGDPNSAPGLWDGEIKTEEHGYLTDLIADKTIHYIREYSGRKQPFLMSVHFNAPHWPWEGPEDEAAALKGGMSGFEAGNLATYGAMVKEMDKAIGRILRESGAQQLLEEHCRRVHQRQWRGALFRHLAVHRQEDRTSGGRSCEFPR